MGRDKRTRKNHITDTKQAVYQATNRLQRKTHFALCHTAASKKQIKSCKGNILIAIFN